MRPASAKLDVATSSEALLRTGESRSLGPMIEDMLRLELRRTMETEAVTAGERAEGRPLPGCGTVRSAVRRSGRFHPARGGGAAEELEGLANRLVQAHHEVVAPAGTVHRVDR